LQSRWNSQTFLRVYLRGDLDVPPISASSSFKFTEWFSLSFIFHFQSIDISDSFGLFLPPSILQTNSFGFLSIFLCSSPNLFLSPSTLLLYSQKYSSSFDFFLSLDLDTCSTKKISFQKTRLSFEWLTTQKHKQTKQLNNYSKDCVN